MNTTPVTRNQVDLIARLVRERDITNVIGRVETAREQVMARTLTFDAASRLISTLMDQPRIPTPLGMHLLGGTMYRVVKSRGSDRRYAQKVIIDPETGEVTFDRDRAMGVVFRLNEDTRVSAEQAAEFGATHHRCCNCGKDLTDPRSTTAGYGPKCAKAHGWPWGEVATAALVAA